MIKAIGLLSALLLMTGLAVAYADLDLDPLTQDINVGDTGTYTVTLETDDIGSVALQWSTDSSLVLARIDGVGSFAQFGSYPFSSTGGVQTFTLEVQPQDGVTLNNVYHIKVRYLDKEGEVSAVVTGNVVPVPEIATLGLVGTGLIGLVFLRRKK